jgi:hypothetical protein
LKKFTFLTFTVFLLSSLIASAQQITRLSPATSSAPGTTLEKRKPVHDEKCATMRHLEDVYKQNPGLKQANEALLQQLSQNRNPQQGGGANQRLNAIVTIPIVFHIVLPNPYIVTDADIQAQVDRLNKDYSGLNIDSTNVPTDFQNVRGHCQIRFCLAQRTPAGLPTNGIERRSSGTAYTGGATDPIKVTASGGLDAWDFNQYFNIWVGTGGGILGYATFPGTSTASQQGVVTDIIGTAANPCYVDPNYNMGRTLTHEAGHYFGLFHIWGDDGGACTSSDFRNLGGACVISDPTLAGAAGDNTIGDTPNQGDQNFGCPSGTLTNSCSANPPGDMYQNYMDYTDDACMTMFTKKQAERMEWVVANCRSGYLTSPGCLPPVSGPSLDAAPVAVVNPGGNELGAGCSVINYGTPICPGAITPKMRITNNGLTTMTSVTVGVRIGSGPASTTTINSISLSGGQTMVVTLPSITLATGANELKFFTSSPNGVADANSANDTLTVTVNISAPSAFPVSQNFNSPAIAPWSVQSNGVPPVWQLATPTGVPPSSPTNVTSAVINNFDFDGGGKHDDIRTPIINTTGLTSAQISFDIAYSPFSATFVDTFVVLISKDCGLTYTEVYRKGGTQLATKPGFTTTLFTPATTAEWRKEVINLTPADLTGSLFVIFRNIGRFGNRLWLDNINIANVPVVDITASTITRPNTFECGSFQPGLTVRNISNENVNSFKVGYILDNGAPVITAINAVLAPSGTYAHNFPAISPAGGTHTIKLFVADPLTASGIADASRANDTLTRTFTVPTSALPNIVQGFEGTTFVPAGWVLLNPNNNVTWVRTTPGKSSSYSAFFDNYNNNVVGQIDAMQTPQVNTVGADGVTITFDVAHKFYQDPSGSAADRLRVLVSTDCGATFTSVYSKSGATLATAGPSDLDFTDPTEAQWRTETINLNSTFTGGNILVQFENRNDWGNNIFIDNINIAPKFKRDARLVSLTPDIQCAAAYTPTATIINNGTEAITGYKIAYRIGTAAPDTTTVTGVNIAPGTTATITLTPRTLAAGANTVTVYTFAPVTASGTGDQYTVNDTLVKTVYFATTVAAPLVETFEGASFVPVGWASTNPDAATTWQKAGTGFNSNSSAFMRNWGYAANKQIDQLFTPVFTFSDVDSVKLTFDLSAATRDYPGSTTIPMDTLEVLVTRDCGTTYTSVYKKWGADLQTINSPNSPVPYEFTPNAYYLWRKETVNLTAFAPAGPLQVVFRNTTNNQNNVFIDNVNFSTRTLPAPLRQNGYVISPSPFSDQFNIWYVQAPSDLRYATVHNAAGQLIWNKVFSSGSTTNVINVDLTGKSAGVYILNLSYSDKSKDTQTRIFKSN